MKDDERWTIRRAFRLPSSRERMRAEVDEELEFHIRGRMEELMSQGVARDDADREARRRFGDFGRIEHEVEQYTRKAERRRTVRDRLDAFVRDVRYAGRSLLRQPVFSLVVIVTLTLGIGATAAIFHAIDRVVLRPLPYPDAERIVYLGTRWDKTTPIGALPAGRFQFWHDNSRVFDGLATYRWFEARVGENDDAKPIEGIRVTPSYLDIVGARPIVGRGFGARDYAPEASPVAILGHSLWMSGFGGDPRVLDRTIRLDGNVYSVVGVLPASFEIAELTTSPSVVLPLVLSPSQLADGGANYTTIGRLRSGMGEAQISRDMATVFERFRRAFPEHVEKDDLGVAVMKYTQIFGSELATQLWISLGATLFVFLLACANVSNIVFARALTRQREFAVRAALGAGRWRIVRQVVIEMMWLGIISAALATEKKAEAKKKP